MITEYRTGIENRANMLQVLLLILWVAWIAQAVLSVLIVRRFARYLAVKQRAKFQNHQPRATVIVPFKGAELNLPGMVRCFCSQEYPQYRLFLVVESKCDPAYSILVEQLRHYPHCRVQVLVSGAARANQGQKLHNQLAAIDRIVGDSLDDDVWVFADSDVAPGPHWLADLVGPLVDRRKTGATTGYRWLVPDGSGRGLFWSSIAGVLNSSAACFLGKARWTYAWGGSMAMRACTARRGDLRRRLEGALTDDYPVTQMCAALGMRVYFRARCLVATPVAMGLKDLANFAHRQCLITRVYEPRIYWVALGVTCLFLAGFTSATVHTLYWLWREPSGNRWWGSAGVCALVFVAHQVRASYRSLAVRRAFDEGTVRRLGVSRVLDRWLTPIWMTMHWAFLVRAGFGRTLRWRGIRYRLHGPQSIERFE
ncbi:MAG: glycosyltransferase family 2 protein [Pirellulaceae bacterium]|nr:glycosyltransferase family 2 protein [Pirellulaceae bacterium]